MAAEPELDRPCARSRPRSFGPPALALAGAATSAGLLWLSAPTKGLSWLAWVALVPAAVVALRQPPTRLSRLAVPLAFGVYLELELVTALPFGIAAGQWGRPLIPLTADSPIVIAGLGVPLLCAALYALRFGQALPLPEGRGAWLAAVLWPATCWTALDFLRVLGDPGSYWGPLFLSQADTPATHLTAIGGPWVITFALVAVNYALARRLVGKHARPQRKTASVGALGVLAVALLVWPLLTAVKDPPLTVAAVQPGYDTAEPDIPVLRFWRERRFDLAAVEVIGDLAALTEQAAARGADLVAWPEASVFVDPLSYAPARQALEELSRRTETTVVVPYFLPDRAQGKSVVVAPNGQFARPQSKQRPMWYIGERRTEGQAPTPVPAENRRLGSLLGTDNRDPGLAARFARKGASLLASSTHDWEELGVAQRSYARLNAASTGLPVVRADWRYGSAIYGGGGRVLADAGLERRRTVVMAELPASRASTLYESVGNVAGWFALTAVGVAVLFRANRRRHKLRKTDRR